MQLIKLEELAGDSHGIAWQFGIWVELPIKGKRATGLKMEQFCKSSNDYQFDKFLRDENGNLHLRLQGSICNSMADRKDASERYGSLSLSTCVPWEFLFSLLSLRYFCVSCVSSFRSLK